MASQSSSQGSCSSTKYREKRRTCFCGERPVLRTSSTVENPGRRFWGCINYQKAERKFALALAVGILGWTMAGLLLYDRHN
ncbi:hypothetical protein Ahy_A09g043213 [Arachis hypogaea]|uniref:Uncharacterized protein n=1 Tax=Arachis hypogaea TaxID=3818 RepID=A0A445BHU7_ARAHY|nr:hypothetical protein Ahy_A09g043213 [Arachis hypogaea]